MKENKQIQVEAQLLSKKIMPTKYIKLYLDILNSKQIQKKY